MPGPARRCQATPRTAQVLRREAAYGKSTALPTMKVLVTGASGLVGRRLVPRLLHDGMARHRIRPDARGLWRRR
jgi:hypothetical protein